MCPPCFPPLVCRAGVSFQQHVEQRADAVRSAIRKVRLHTRAGQPATLLCFKMLAVHRLRVQPALQHGCLQPLAPAASSPWHPPSLPQAGGAADAELAVALIENSSRCPTNEEGEKVVPGEVPWIVDLVDKVRPLLARMYRSLYCQWFDADLVAGGRCPALWTWRTRWGASGL